jgi:hypothetical protein
LSGNGRFVIFLLPALNSRTFLILSPVFQNIPYFLPLFPGHSLCPELWVIKRNNYEAASALKIPQNTGRRDVKEKSIIFQKKF